VGQGGATEAGRKFVGNGCTTGLLTTFQKQRLETGLGEVKGGNQPIVAASDDDYIAPLRH
jgi:hypothetical protein